MTGPAFGLVQGRLNASAQGVAATAYRSDPADTEGGYQQDSWTEQVASFKIAQNLVQANIYAL